MMERVPMSMIRRANLAAGGHWFSPDTMRFFRSRVARVGYKGTGPIYFVSSEQFVPSRGPAFPRQYTVRVALADGSINTVGTLGDFASSATATAAARRLASQEG